MKEMLLLLVRWSNGRKCFLGRMTISVFHSGFYDSNSVADSTA